MNRFELVRVNSDLWYWILFDTRRTCVANGVAPSAEMLVKRVRRHIVRGSTLLEVVLLRALKRANLDWRGRPL